MLKFETQFLGYSANYTLAKIPPCTLFDFFLFQEYLNQQDKELNNLRQMMSEKDEESKKRQSMFEAKLREMETSRANLTTSGGGPLKNEKMMMMSRNFLVDVSHASFTSVQCLLHWKHVFLYQNGKAI